MKSQTFLPIKIVLAKDDMLKSKIKVIVIRDGLLVLFYNDVLEVYKNPDKKVVKNKNTIFEFIDKISFEDNVAYGVEEMIKI